MSTKTYKGSCHCGKVRYEADIDLSAGTGKWRVDKPTQEEARSRKALSIGPQIDQCARMHG